MELRDGKILPSNFNDLPALQQAQSGIHGSVKRPDTLRLMRPVQVGCVKKT